MIEEAKMEQAKSLKTLPSLKQLSRQDNPDIFEISAEQVTSDLKMQTRQRSKLKDCNVCQNLISRQGIINCCSHTFCFQCIKKWSETENSCPICKRRFSQIKKSLMVKDLNESSILSQRNNDQIEKVANRTQVDARTQELAQLLSRLHPFGFMQYYQQASQNQQLREAGFSNQELGFGLIVEYYYRNIVVNRGGFPNININGLQQQLAQNQFFTTTSQAFQAQGREDYVNSQRLPHSSSQRQTLHQPISNQTNPAAHQQARIIQVGQPFSISGAHQQPLSQNRSLQRTQSESIRSQPKKKQVKKAYRKKKMITSNSSTTNKRGPLNSNVKITKKKKEIKVVLTKTKAIQKVLKKKKTVAAKTLKKKQK